MASECPQPDSSADPTVGLPVSNPAFAGLSPSVPNFGFFGVTGGPGSLYPVGVSSVSGSDSFNSYVVGTRVFGGSRSGQGPVEFSNVNQSEPNTTSSSTSVPYVNPVSFMPGPSGAAPRLFCAVDSAYPVLPAAINRMDTLALAKHTQVILASGSRTFDGAQPGSYIPYRVWLFDALVHFMPCDQVAVEVILSTLAEPLRSSTRRTCAFGWSCKQLLIYLDSTYLLVWKRVCSKASWTLSNNC
jgi:hypothetical protein